MLEHTNLTDQSKSEIKKSDDDLLSNYIALLFLKSIFESSNKYSGGTHQSAKSSSSNRRQETSGPK